MENLNLHRLLLTESPAPLQPPPLSSFSSVFFVLLVFILSSNPIYSQYFDIGESQSSPSALKGEDCSLPTSWAGNWFQSGVHHLISINNRSIISTKGQCVETDGDKYLFYNPFDKCFRCVVFHEKHQNVLQYKETFCHHSRQSLRSLCSTIQADYHLMSMFRLDAVPVPCPFDGSFTLSYNRGYGNCAFPVSTLNSCIQPTRVVFNYQACPDIHGTESATEEVECIATWKESSSRYLLGLIRYHYPASYEERFRCFVYEKENGFRPTSSSLSSHGRRTSGSSSNSTDNTVEVIRVAQSGDATCLGLTPNEGSKTLVLRKDPRSSPCQFPSWLLRHAHWESLSQEMIYEFESSTLRIGNYSTANGVGLLTQAVCIQIIHKDLQEGNNDEDENESSISNSNSNTNQATKTKTKKKNNSENLTDKITLVLHSTTDCQTGFICMTVYKRENHLIEIQSGRLSRTAENACHQSYFDPVEVPYITLTSPTPESRECPFHTSFDISSISSKTGTWSNGDHACQTISDHGTIGSFSMGCDKLDMIELETNKNCVAAARSEKTAEKYKCLGWWEEANGENYLVVSSVVGNNSSLGGGRGGGGGTSTNSRQRNYNEKRSCFVFYETTPTTQLGELSSLSLLHSSSRRRHPHGRKNQEINLAEEEDQEQESREDDDDDDDDNDNGKEGEEDDVEKEESQLNKRNLKRQFHFIRFEESCERRPQRRKLLLVSDSSRKSNDDDGVQIGLMFNASTSYYYENNCHTAASSRKSDGGRNNGGSGKLMMYSMSIFTNSGIILLTLQLVFHPVLQKLIQMQSCNL